MNQHESVLLIKEPVQTSLGQDNFFFSFFFFLLIWPVKFQLLAWDHWRQAWGLSSSFLFIGLILCNFKRASQVRRFLFHKKVPILQEDPRKEPWVSHLIVACRFLRQSLCSWRQGHLAFGTHVRILEGEWVGAPTGPWRARLSPQFVSTVKNWERKIRVG